VAQAVKCLLCKHLLFEVKALSSNPIPAKQQKTVNKIQLQRKPSFKVLSLTRQHFAGFKIIPIQFYAMHFYKQSPKLYKAQAQEQQTQRDDETLLAGVCVCVWGCQQIPSPLEVPRGKRSENWVCTGQGEAKSINLLWISSTE
jgi:hypothetical protein